jgi:hypothetical protein
MQLAFEFPAVIVRPATGAVPLLVGVGVGVGVGEGDGPPGDEGGDVGPPLAEGLPFDDGVPLGDGLLPRGGLLPGGGLTVADAPRPAPSAALPMLAPAAIVHGPCTGAVAGLVISSQSGVLFDE